MGSDSILHRVQLNKKSLSRLFPSWSKQITSIFRENSKDPEQQVIRLLEEMQ
jgi:hypothetical protein